MTFFPVGSIGSWFAGIWASIVEWAVDLKDEFVLNFIEKDRWQFLAEGLLTTLEVTFFAVLLGVLIGVIVAAVRSTYDQRFRYMRKGLGKTAFAIANWICKAYLTIIRGTPVTVQIMIAYFVIFASSRAKVLIAVLAFGFNSGAYVAEIFRSGIMSVDQGQTEAGRSLGFSYLKTMYYIVLPQAIKNVLPALANEFIVLLKETSVAGLIALQDLTKGGNIIRGVTYSDFMPLLAVAGIYLVIVMILTKLVSLLERRLRNSER